jgi:hypothetical protein
MDRRLTALCAVTAGALSGIASAVAILYADWNFF